MSSPCNSFYVMAWDQGYRARSVYEDRLRLASSSQSVSTELAPVYENSEHRTTALGAWLTYYNCRRPHSALGHTPR